MSKSKYYVDSKDLESRIEKYYENGSHYDSIVEDIYKIIQNKIRTYSYTKEFNEDLVSVGLIYTIEQLREKDYDKTKGSAYTWVNLKAEQAFSIYIREEYHRNSYIRGILTGYADDNGFQKFKKYLDTQGVVNQTPGKYKKSKPTGPIPPEEFIELKKKYKSLRDIQRNTKYSWRRVREANIYFQKSLDKS